MLPEFPMGLWWIPVALLIALVAIWLVGWLLPRHHRARSTVTLRAAPADVWQAITDWRRYPEWLPSVKTVTELRAPDGRVGFTEQTRFGPLPLLIEQQDDGRRLVTAIADERLPFGGTWTWELEPAADQGTLLTITEDGYIKAPIFRALSRFVFGYHKTIDQFLVALGRKFGEASTPAHG
jgi:uncharacterized protein YndB with AHSA1/START domain